MDAYIFNRSERFAWRQMAESIFDNKAQFSGTFDERGVMRLSVHIDQPDTAPPSTPPPEPEKQVA
jgi:hypothetical protein